MIILLSLNSLPLLDFVEIFFFPYLVLDTSFVNYRVGGGVRLPIGVGSSVDVQDPAGL